MKYHYHGKQRTAPQVRKTHILSHDTGENVSICSVTMNRDSHRGDALLSELRLIARCGIDSGMNRNRVDRESIY